VSRVAEVDLEHGHDDGVAADFAQAVQRAGADAAVFADRGVEGGLLGVDHVVEAGRAGVRAGP